MASVSTYIASGSDVPLVDPTALFEDLMTNFGGDILADSYSALHSANVQQETNNWSVRSSMSTIKYEPSGFFSETELALAWVI
jgi:hypothetical protein